MLLPLRGNDPPDHRLLLLRRPEHLVIRARPHLVQRLDRLQNPRLEGFVERPQFFQRWRATAGSACQWIAKVQPKPGPSGSPWRPAFPHIVMRPAALFEFLNAGLQLGEEFTNGVQPTRIEGGLDDRTLGFGSVAQHLMVINTQEIDTQEIA